MTTQETNSRETNSRETNSRETNSRETNSRETNSRETNSAVAVRGQFDIAPRPVPRAMKNAGFDIDEDITAQIVEMKDLDEEIFLGGEMAGISLMTRYSINRDRMEFDKTDFDRDKKAWDHFPVLEGVIIQVVQYRQKRQKRAYREGEDNPVMCRSTDMVTGHGAPGGNCTACQFKEWPEDWERDNGITTPFCGDRLLVFFKNDEELTPQYIDLPGVHYKKWENYQRQLAKRGARMWQVNTQMQLTKVNNNTTVVFEELAMIDSENHDVVEAIGTIRNAIAGVMKQYATWHLQYLERDGEAGDETGDAPRDRRDRDDAYGNAKENPRRNPNTVDSTAREPEQRRPGPERGVAMPPASPVGLEPQYTIDNKLVYVDREGNVFADQNGDHFLYRDDGQPVPEPEPSAAGTGNSRLDRLAAARERNRAQGQA